MEIHQLRYFCSVAHHGNITKAANELLISQPALSRSIKKLEEELGVDLFDRIGRHIELNKEGEVFLNAVEGALRAVDSVGQTLERYVREKSSTLNIRNPVYFGDDERVLGEFIKQHPDIYIRCASESTPFFQAEVPDLTFFASFNRHDEENCMELGREDVVLSVPRTHPLAQASSVRLSDLRYEKFVTVLPCSARRVFDAMFAEAGFEPHLVIEDQHCRSINALVSYGLGVALVPAVTWFSSHDKELVKAIPISDIKKSRTLYLKWAENTRLSSAAVIFRDYLIDYYRGLDECYQVE